MTPFSFETLHASCVAINGYAVLLTGRSGSGKSDVALRLIDRGGVLVSDDQTVVHQEDGILWASPPATIQGRMEVRGLGIVDMPFVSHVPVAMIVELDSEVARLPEPGAGRVVAGLMLPTMPASPFEPSTPIKIEMALKQRIKQ